MSAARPPERGDVVRIDRLDGAEDPTGDPEQAQLYKRSYAALYWGRIESYGVPAVVTVSTHDSDGYVGFHVYPEACITRIHVVRRARRKH